MSEGKQQSGKYKVGFMKTEDGRTIPMYSTDKIWLELKAKLIKKVDDIEQSLKLEVVS